MTFVLILLQQKPKFSIRAGVLDALASYIQNMLMEIAKEEVHMLLGVSGEIDNMGIKLQDLKNFIADADRRNITDQKCLSICERGKGCHV
jgi:hypothetical protein